MLVFFLAMGPFHLVFLAQSIVVSNRPARKHHQGNMTHVVLVEVSHGIEVGLFSHDLVIAVWDLSPRVEARMMVAAPDREAEMEVEEVVLQRHVMEVVVDWSETVLVRYSQRFHDPEVINGVKFSQILGFRFHDSIVGDFFRVRLDCVGGDDGRFGVGIWQIVGRIPLSEEIYMFLDLNTSLGLGEKQKGEDDGGNYGDCVSHIVPTKKTMSVREGDTGMGSL
ncbi:hypothetical protein NE237_014048 [Protea cynaroides]|uniref:Uncharacterized protein n=1 Tax=Protea cynaroides TaxID=273540 RepID=A0A9Q0H381_9MAGN|nr:hypothetical protein NE237_014048 [Protea cynaroides]